MLPALQGSPTSARDENASKSRGSPPPGDHHQSTRTGRTDEEGGRGCREGTILSPQDGGGVSEGGREESRVPLGTQLSTQAAP